MLEGDQARVSAPGSAVLFGEYAADSGFPGVAVAAGARVGCTARLAARFTVNGEDLDPAKHPMVRAALLHAWPDMDRPIEFNITRDMPPFLDSDSAVIVACLGAMSMLQDHMIFGHIARDAFLACREMDACTNPLGTSAATHGGIVSVSTGEAGEALWSMKARDVSWHVREIRAPEMEIVVGMTGCPGQPDLRAKIARYCQRNGFARDMLRDLGTESAEGMAALEAGNLAKAGEAMNRCQRLLANLGAANPSQDRLLAAVSRHSYGAKATGFSGDAIVSIPRDAGRAVAAIESAGGSAIRLSPADRGVSPDD